MLSTLGDKIPRKTQVRVGYDPGSVWGAIAIARQVGLVKLKDAPPEGPSSVPDIDVLLLEVWNVKEGKVLRPDEDWNPVWDQLPGFTTKSDEMLDWARAFRALIERCPQLHEVNEEGQLPAVITEQQCDGALSHWQRTEITRLSEQFRAAIDAADEKRGHTKPRVNRSAASKYLLTRALNPNDREKHKKDCQAIQLHLLEQLGLKGPLKFLRAALAMKNGQIHDMCDALGLAIQDMLNHTEAEARAQVRELQAIIREIPRAPKKGRKKKTEEVEDESSKEEKPKAKQKKKTTKKATATEKPVRKKQTKRKKKDSSESEEPVEKPTRKKKATVSKRKRTSESDEIEVIAVSPKSKKVKATEQVDVSNGPVMLLEESI